MLDKYREEQKTATLLTVEEQINHLASKGIQFLVCEQDEAKQYLHSKCNYFKLLSYFDLLIVNPHKRLHPNRPDFTQLQLLASIDQLLRHALLGITLDIEHSTKVLLLQELEKQQEDGYEIVNSYLENLEERDRNRIEGVITMNLKNPYSSWIASKYAPPLPVWVFLELVSFGTLRDFIRFCAERWGNKQLKDLHYDLKRVKSLRNAAAHGSCIINRIADRQHRDDGRLSSNINQLLVETGISKERRKKWMKNPILREIVTALLLHNQLISDGDSRSRTAGELQKFFNRIDTNIAFLGPKEINAILPASLEFLRALTKTVGLLD